MSLISNEPLWRQSDMGQWRHANGMAAGVRLMCLMPRLMPKRRLRFLVCGVAACKSNLGGPDYFHPGRCGRLLQGRSLLAQFGELHPQVAAHFGLRNTLVGF